MAKLVVYFTTFLSLVLPVITNKGVVLLDDTDVSSTISPEPPIPKQLIKFQSSVEINQPGQGFSTGVKEFYDGEHKRSTIIITEMGKTTIVIHNHVTGEVLNIKESISHKLPVYTCTVEQLAQDMVLSSFFNPSWLLRQATKSKEVYMPHAKPIRGIPVNHWKADVLINGANFTVDYFYSDAKVWLNKYKLYQVPVQVQVMGASSKIVYDYYDFLDDIPDESVFQTPEGAYCPNRKSSKQIPTISDQVSYKVEFSSPETEVIFSMNVWVDTRNHFVRLDYGKHLDSGDSELLTEVHDFNLDVNYKIDRVSGKCRLMRLSQSNLLVIDIEEKKSGMTNIRMKHPYEMFNFNHDYQYTGQRFFNGILCDIFIAQVLNYEVSGIPFNVTMEYYFTADNWQEVSDKSTDIEMNLPVLLQIKSLDMSFIQTYRYLDFDQGSMYLSAFDVTNCFKEDKLDFQIDFTRPNLFIMEEKDDIQERCHMAIAKACSVTPLRIENAKFHVEENYLHFVATLVGLPPAYTQFQLDFECIELSRNNKLVYHVSTQEDCAEQCQKESSFVCNAFGYCPIKKLCSLSKNTIDDGKHVPDATCCKHFKRVKSLKHKWLSLEEVWTKLKDAVYQRKIIIEMAEMSIVAVSIRSDVLNGANREIGSPSWQKDFSRLKNHILEGHDKLVLPGLSVDDCASACYDDENFYCLSFDFCYSNGECRLSQETSVMNPQYLKESSTCDVYTLNYLTLFNKYPGQTILPKLDVAYQKVGTPDQCAALCFNYAELECKSFDYCELIQTCVIGRTHILDVPKSQINNEPMCSHYSIKYLTDFKKTNNKILKLSDDEIIADISEEECAKICVENENFICKSFDFCTDSKICMYRSKHYKDTQGGTLQPSVFCNHYARMYLPDGSKFSPTHEKYLSSRNIGYSSASMGTLGFFMLVIGIGGALLSVFIFRRHQRLRKDSMSTNIMKDCGAPIY